MGVDMRHRELARAFFDADLRVDCIVHIATMLTHYAWPENIRSAMEDWPDEFWSAIGFGKNRIEEIAELLEDRISGQEEVSSQLFQLNKLGFVVLFATPVPTFHKNMKGYSTCGFGHCHCQWVYADTLEEAYAKGVEWKKAYIENERQKVRMGG